MGSCIFWKNISDPRHSSQQCKNSLHFSVGAALSERYGQGIISRLVPTLCAGTSCSWKSVNRKIRTAHPIYNFIQAITPLPWWENQSRQLLGPHDAPWSETCCLRSGLCRISRVARATFTTMATLLLEMVGTRRKKKTKQMDLLEAVGFWGLFRVPTGEKNK